MKLERVSLDDYHSWGRALQSYEGACGTGTREPINDLGCDVWGVYQLPDGKLSLFGMLAVSAGKAQRVGGIKY